MRGLIAITILGFILYIVNSCDINTYGVMEDDPGIERLDLYSNGIFKNVCIGKHETAVVGTSNVTNFKCNDGTVVHNITNYIIRK